MEANCKFIVEMSHRYCKEPLVSLKYGSVSKARSFMDHIENIGNPLLSCTLISTKLEAR